jgi:hypothetical protein
MKIISGKQTRKIRKVVGIYENIKYTITDKTALPVCLIIDPGPLFSNRMFLTYLISVSSFGHICILATFSSCTG